MTTRAAPLVLCLIPLATLMLTLPAQAQEASAEQEAIKLGSDHLEIGVGPAFIRAYSGARRVSAVPAVAVEGTISGVSFNTQGTSLSLDCVPGGTGPGWKLQAGPTLGARLDRTTRIGNSQVAALGKLHTAWEPGAWLGLQRTGVVTSPYDTLSASIGWSRAVSGYRGAVANLSVSYATPLSPRDYVDLSAGEDRVGRRFADYYYDITGTGSAASGLRAYGDANRAGWKDRNLDVLADHQLRGTLLRGVGVFGTVGYERILGRYATSPIVADIGRAGQWTGALGVSVSI